MGGRIFRADTDISLTVNGPHDFDITMISAGMERERFSIAHELGHYVLHSLFGQKKIRAARYGSDPIEWEANWFAAAFLMPEELFLRKISEYSNKEIVASFFGVTVPAIDVRIRSIVNKIKLSTTYF
jgi:Zn-dependent peptidase ImmA (M78 family)